MRLLQIAAVAAALHLGGGRAQPCSIGFEMTRGRAFGGAPFPDGMLYSPNPIFNLTDAASELVAAPGPCYLPSGTAYSPFVSGTSVNVVVSTNNATFFSEQMSVQDGSSSCSIGCSSRSQTVTFGMAAITDEAATVSVAIATTAYARYAINITQVATSVDAGLVAAAAPVCAEPPTPATIGDYNALLDRFGWHVVTAGVLGTAHVAALATASWFVATASWTATSLAGALNVVLAGIGASGSVAVSNTDVNAQAALLQASAQLAVTQGSSLYPALTHTDEAMNTSQVFATIESVQPGLLPSGCGNNTQMAIDVHYMLQKVAALVPLLVNATANLTAATTVTPWCLADYTALPWCHGVCCNGTAPATASTWDSILAPARQTLATFESWLDVAITALASSWVDAETFDSLQAFVTGTVIPYLTSTESVEYWCGIRFFRSVDDYPCQYPYGFPGYSDQNYTAVIVKTAAWPAGTVPAPQPSTSLGDPTAMFPPNYMGP